MTKVCLVRHGETDWNTRGILQGVQDTILNAQGRVQAEATGIYLAENHTDFDMLITSSLHRAKETATIINRHLHLPFQEVDAFRERSFGDAEGLSVEERQHKYPNEDFPGQEAESEFYERVVQGFQHIATKYKNQHILLISHGLVINLILSLILQEEVNYKQTGLLNGCINHIQFIKPTWQVNNINMIEHLS